MIEAAIVAVLALPLLAALLLPFVGAAAAGHFNVAASTLVALGATALGVFALARGGEPPHGAWYVLDAPAGVFLVVVATIGLCSAIASPGYLRSVGPGFFGERAPRRSYYVALQLFWAALLAIPIVDNLAVAWILVEATTAASALLVAYGGGRRALEAGWKYLLLTTLGLTVALLGILVLFVALAGDGGSSLGTVDWSAIRAGGGVVDPQVGYLALVLILAGLAAKIGWAPVHNWLPDAHSEAPPPVSALLSAVLLPTVMLVAWRAEAALEPATGGVGGAVFLAFGLASLAVAVPFLWRPLALKRLLAYSSLEHMGVLALGIGFGTPLAIAGVVLHLAGHALGKSLGFYASIPLLRAEPALAREPLDSLAARSPSGAAAVGVSLGTLSGLPPSPLFFSEVLILLGGLAAGEPAIVAVAAVVMALGFVGLAHALIEGVIGAEAPAPKSSRPQPRLALLAGLFTLALLALSATAAVLPGSELVNQVIGAMR